MCMLLQRRLEGPVETASKEHLPAGSHIFLEFEDWEG